MAKKPKASIDTNATGTSMGALIRPEQLAASGTEHGHQCAIFQWIALNKVRMADGDLARDIDMLFAIPNGGDRQAHVGASMRAEGVKPGVPDMCWPIQKESPKTGNVFNLLLSDGLEWPTYSGLYMELKIPGRERQKDGGCQPKQVDWHTKLLAQGYAVVVAYGWQAACWALMLYWNGELVMPSEGGPLLATPVENAPVVKWREEDGR